MQTKGKYTVPSINNLKTHNRSTSNVCNLSSEAESCKPFRYFSPTVLWTLCFLIILLFSQTYFHLLYNIKVSDFGCSQWPMKSSWSILAQNMFRSLNTSLFKFSPYSKDWNVYVWIWYSLFSHRKFPIYCCCQISLMGFKYAHIRIWHLMNDQDQI